MDAETFERGHLERQGQREDLVRTDAAYLPCRCCHHPEDFLQLLTLQTFIRTQQGHCFYVHMVILNTPRKDPVPSMLEEKGLLSLSILEKKINTLKSRLAFLN